LEVSENDLNILARERDFENNEFQKYTPTDCFFGGFAHWINSLRSVVHSNFIGEKEVKLFLVAPISLIMQYIFCVMEYALTKRIFIVDY